MRTHRRQPVSLGLLQRQILRLPRQLQRLPLITVAISIVDAIFKSEPDNGFFCSSCPTHLNANIKTVTINIILIVLSFMVQNYSTHKFLYQNITETAKSEVETPFSQSHFTCLPEQNLIISVEFHYFYYRKD